MVDDVIGLLGAARLKIHERVCATPQTEREHHDQRTEKVALCSGKNCMLGAGIREPEGIIIQSGLLIRDDLQILLAVV
jgi:hypothetical protein